MLCSTGGWSVFLDRLYEFWEEGWPVDQIHFNIASCCQRFEKILHGGTTITGTDPIVQVHAQIIVFMLHMWQWQQRDDFSYCYVQWSNNNWCDITKAEVREFRTHECVLPQVARLCLLRPSYSLCHIRQVFLWDLWLYGLVEVSLQRPFATLSRSLGPR